MPELSHPPIHPSVLRNRDPILEVLRRVFADAENVLEVASGGGAHAWYFARHLPHLTWQPSDLAPENRADIERWRAHQAIDNLLAPLALDARETPWPVESADAVYCGNMIHISPWETALGLFAGAARTLPQGGVLVTYGPYKIGGAHTAPSNAAFDESLRSRNPEWGVRDLEAIVEAAAGVGFEHEEQLAMPANNFTLVFRRQSS